MGSGTGDDIGPKAADEKEAQARKEVEAIVRENIDNHPIQSGVNYKGFFSSMDQKPVDKDQAIKTIDHLLADSSLLQSMQRSIKCTGVTQRSFIKYIRQTDAKKIAHDNVIDLGEARNLKAYIEGPFK